MATDDYLADYALLGLQPGCSLLTLERAWRQGVSALHPDRAAPDSDPARLGRRMHELSAAYRRLRQFEREHGRLPGAPLPAPMSAAGSPAQAGLPAAGSSSADSVDTVENAAAPASPRATAAGRHAGAWLPVLALGSAVAITLWGLDGSSAPTAPAAIEAPLAAAAPATAAPGAPGGGRAAAPGITDRGAELPIGSVRRIRIGSTEADVERLMGAPIAASPQLWEYGPSHVRFERGRVVGWYSSPLLPLPVDSEQR